MWWADSSAFGSRRLSPAPTMSYNPLDDVPLSIRSGAKPRPSAEGVAPSSAMDFPSQFSDADFEGDSDDSDLGARHSPAPGPAQRQRFSDQLHLYLDITCRPVLWLNLLFCLILALCPKYGQGGFVLYAFCPWDPRIVLGIVYWQR